MHSKSYFQISAFLFLVGVIVHAWHLWSKAPIMIGSWEMPAYVSWASVVVAGYMAYQGFRLSR